jgi:hypothetical protein
LHRPIYLRERGIVASLRCRNGASQRCVRVAAGSVACGAHPKCAVRRATIRPTERLPTTRGICGVREIARQPPHRCTIPSGWCISAISRSGNGDVRSQHRTMSVFVVLPDACHAYVVTLRAAVSGVVTGLIARHRRVECDPTRGGSRHL